MREQQSVRPAAPPVTQSGGPQLGKPPGPHRGNPAAGSKPAIGISIINKLLKLLTVWSPPHPSVPHRCHQTCHQRFSNRPTYWSGPRHHEPSSAAGKPDRPTAPTRYTSSAAGASPGATRRSRGKSHLVSDAAKDLNIVIGRHGRDREKSLSGLTNKESTVFL